MSIKTNCKNFKSRTCPANSLTLVDKYKFEVLYDSKYFGNKTNLFHCNQCDICFPDPIPSSETLDDYYKFIYRAQNRPHSINDVYPPGVLESRLELLTKNIDFSKIKNVLEIIILPC